MRGVNQHVVELVEDEHLFIWVKRGDRPDVGLDLSMKHGRGVLSVRSNGMTLGGFLVDVEALPCGGDPQLLERFCPYCGEPINLVSSKSHVCEVTNSSRTDPDWVEWKQLERLVVEFPMPWGGTA